MTALVPWPHVRKEKKKKKKPELTQIWATSEYKYTVAQITFSMNVNKKFILSFETQAA